MASGKLRARSTPADIDTSDIESDVTRAAGHLAEALLGARVWIDVTVPRTTVKGRMRLLSVAEDRTVAVETRDALKDYGMPSEGVGAREAWVNENALRTIQIAIRNPDDETEPLADVDEWQECDDDQITALWVEYQSLRDRHDPLGESAPGLTQEELDALTTAVKKKDRTVLMSFGSRRLADFAITLANRPAS